MLFTFEWWTIQPKNGYAKIVSEYDQEIPQSQTADNPIAKQSNQLTLTEKLLLKIRQFKHAHIFLSVLCTLSYSSIMSHHAG